MGSKGGDAEVEVNDYYLSMHVGVAHNVDAVTRIYYGEKEFWSGYATTNTRLLVSKTGLHGGNKKEGGVAGAINILLGGTSQVLSDELAVKLGRGSGANSPGFRGLTSMFFTGSSSGGFYWSSNTPYLKPVWTTVLRAPKGLNPAKALIGGSVILSSPAINVRLILNFNGANGSTTFTDSSLNGCAVSPTGSGARPNITTLVTSPAGGACGAFYASGGQAWLGVSNAANNLTFGSDDFCVEVWARKTTAQPQKIVFCSQYHEYAGIVGIIIGVGIDNKWYTNSGIHAISSSITATVGSWFHLALTRQGDLFRFFINGTVVGTYTCTAGASVPMIGPHDNYFIGTLTSYEYYDWVGNMDALRVTQGSARYTSNFTPPTSNLQDDSRGPMYEVASQATANPAHIIYECLTNSDWGMGESSNLIDVASFEACCDTLYAEIFGLSMIWTRQSTVEDFTNEVLKHINGVVFTNPRTGLHTMRLIRGGYDESTLREINPDNANLLKFSRRVWGETTNEVVVTWTNPETEKEETVGLQDLGNISMQGAVISASRNYYGVRSKELAMQLAARELRVAASPLCTCDIELDRSAWDILPADVVKLTWPEYGVAGLPMRVGTVDYGRIGDSKVKVTLVEDIFALPLSYFEVPPTTEWETGLTFPAPVVTSKVFTLPAYASAALAPSGLPSLVYPNAFAGIFAESPDAGSFSFELTGQSVDTLGSTTWVQRSTLSFTSSGALTSAIDSEASSLIASFSSITGSGPSVAGFGLIGDGPESISEMVLFSAFDTATGYTVKRGVLDTVPRDWPLGTKIWFFDATGNAYDGTTLSAGLSPQYKLLTNASMGQLAIPDAPIVTGMISERPHLPLRPANFKVATLGFGTFDAIEMSTVTLTWSNRNRLTEETIVLGWTDGDTPGEAGQTTRIVVTSDTGTVLTTIPALSGTSYVLPLSAYSAVGTIRVKAYAEKDGLISLQAHEIRLINIGVLRKTNTGDVRVIHTGEARFPVVA